MRLICNPKDLYAGLLFMAFGLAALAISWSYPIGGASRMGPGYFPRVLGILLLGLGALLSLRGLRSTGEVQPVWHWRPLFIVLLGVGFFCLTAKWLGLVVSGMALVFISSVASEEFRWKEALVSGAIQSVAAVVVFVYGLDMPLPIWPVLITGVH
ncbi:MAG: tripartite tricarboxylate transporter TctB family protein [Syntrophales bacterium]